jgi:1-acyl-sn-glycerol-3-phosphate acyltransferase
VIAFLRRMALAAAMLGLAFVVLALLPVVLIAAAALSPIVPGRLRPLRVLWMVLMHVMLETVMILGMLDLWVFSGFGWAVRRPFFERAHYTMVRSYLSIMFREAQRVLRLKVVREGEAPDQAAPGPVLVLCRHAGPADSFTVIHALQNWYAREPRVVLKWTMALDPGIGLVLHRLPARFISPQPRSRAAGDAIEAEIADLATGLDDNDAFVIFPEGGNFSSARRQRAIDSLRRHGHARMAERAERMANVLPPRPGGVLAALDAAPSADVMFVAHTGLDHLVTMRAIYRELPMDKQIIMRWWRVPWEEVPLGRDERIDWLFSWWERIDAWVSEHRTEALGAGEDATAVP